MPPQRIEAHFPIGGIDRYYAFQKQPGVYTTPKAVNVQPEGTAKGRERGGSRRGLDLRFSEQLGAGAVVNMLSSMEVANGDSFKYITDSFLGSAKGGRWNTPTDTYSDPTFSDDGFAKATYSGGTVQTGLVHDAISDLPATQYTIELKVVPDAGAVDGQWEIWLGMDNSTPDINQDGVIVRLDYNGASGTYGGAVVQYASGTPTTTNFTGTGTIGYPGEGILRVRISGTTSLTAEFRDKTLISSHSLSALSGSRVGFGLTADVSGATCKADFWRIYYTSSTANQFGNRRILYAASAGTFYRWTNGKMSSEVVTASPVATTHLSAAPRLNVLYVADHSEPLSRGTDGVRGTGNNRFDAASVSDWTTLSIDTDRDVLVTFNSSDNSVLFNATFAITTVASGELTLAADIANAAGQTCSWMIVRGPKKWDEDADDMTLWSSTTGTGVPGGCPIVVQHMDRMWLAGFPEHAWYASRQSDPDDFDFSADDTDAQRAVGGATSEIGLVGEQIKALIPHGEHCMLFGCTASMFVLRGNPAAAGSINILSRSIGVVSRSAWCFTHGREPGTVFLSRDGVYFIRAGCGSPPVPISEDKIPQELLNLDEEQATILMEYDREYDAVHIFVTYNTAAPSKHWYLDWQTKGFFEVAFSTTDHEPISAHWWEATDVEDRSLMLGCRDGYIRYYSNFNLYDSGGNAISSECWIGPFDLGASQGREGLLKMLDVVTAADSGDVDVAVHVGKDAESAFNSTAFGTYEFNTAGHNARHHPRASGGAAYIKITNGQNGLQWQLERVLVEREVLGERRIG